MAFVLGIDPGWVNLGWSDAVGGGTLELCEYRGPIANLLPAARRMARSFHESHPLLRYVGIERQHSTFQHGCLMSYLHAAFLLECPDVVVVIVSPMTIRQHFGFLGPQKEAASVAAMRCGFIGTQQHEVDAFLICLYVRERYLGDVVTILDENSEPSAPNGAVLRLCNDRRARRVRPSRAVSDGTTRATRPRTRKRAAEGAPDEGSVQHPRVPDGHPEGRRQRRSGKLKRPRVDADPSRAVPVDDLRVSSEGDRPSSAGLWPNARRKRRPSKLAQ